MADPLDAAGRVVAVPLALLARVRHAKPMHPRGVVFSAVLERRGGSSGVRWLDEVRTDEVLVRISRGAGLPRPLPDVLGLAVRVPGEHPVDLLLSSTGSGRWTRRVPLPRLSGSTPYGSIMAYSSAAGPVLLRADPQDGLPSDEAGLLAGGAGRVLTLAAAVGDRPETSFATLTLRAPTDPADPPLHFDAVLDAPPGLVADGPLARFRRPAYAAARAARAPQEASADPQPS